MQKRITLTAEDLLRGQIWCAEVQKTEEGGVQIAYRQNMDRRPGMKIPVCEHDLTGDGVYTLTFCARSLSRFDTVDVAIIGISGEQMGEFTYQLAGQWTEICMPFVATEKLEVLCFTFGGRENCVQITDVAIVPAAEDMKHAKRGYWMKPSPEWVEHRLPWGSGLQLGNCMDTASFGDYVYAIADERVHVFAVDGQTKKLEKIYSSEAYGELRQIAMDENGRAMAVTARSNGVFLFSLEDPRKPILTARIDSLEAATGIDIAGNFCYIADRVFGIDIFDIADLRHPVMVSNIPTGETQDCKYYNGFVYAGVWGACQVKICDVRNPDAPMVAGIVPLMGRGDGLCVRDGFLYAATGHSQAGSHVTDKPGYAIGNGMEIFELSDGAKPRLVSRVRTDGQLYASYPDIWRVEVVDKRAFLASTYNGVYIYDISNQELPKRLAHITVVAENGETAYRDLKEEDHWVYPFDTGKERHASIIDCHVTRDHLLLSGAESDLYVLPYAGGQADLAEKAVLEITYTGSYYDNDFEALGFQAPRLYKNGGQIWSCDFYKDYIYASAGSEGIILLNEKLEEICRYPSKDITNDLRIFGDYLYTAENAAGLCIYKIDPNTPEKLTLCGQYREDTLAIVEVALSPDGRFALVQSGSFARLLDVSDVYKPCRFGEFYNRVVYQNQMTRQCVGNRYLAFFGNNRKTIVFDFGENGCFAKPRIYEGWKSGLQQQYGIAALGENVLGTYPDGIYRFRLDDERLFEKVLAENPLAETFQVAQKWRGTPYVLENWLVVTHRSNGEIYFAKLPLEERCEVVKCVKVKGHPGRAVCKNGRGYIPLGYGGLLAFDL